jgi:hypothetical protein
MDRGVAVEADQRPGDEAHRAGPAFIARSVPHENPGDLLPWQRRDAIR